MLFRCVLLNKLGREKEVQDQLIKLRKRDITLALNDVNLMLRLKTRLILWEALGGYEDGFKQVSETIAMSLRDPGKLEAGILEQLFHLRARMSLLSGDYAGVLADEKSAIALPLKATAAGTNYNSSEYTEAQVRQSHLNTMVMQWELLEHEFPDYADYLESNDSPDPQPDRRDLRDKD